MIAALETAPSAAVQQWSELPNNLLCAIYSRIERLRARVRFAAVCTRWRRFASLPYPQRLALRQLSCNPCEYGGNDKTEEKVYSCLPPFPHDALDDKGPPSSAVHRWSELPTDLLCAIYHMLGTHLDRARFDAVCASWRATASHTQRRVTPWLILDNAGGDETKQYAYCPLDRTVLPRLPLLRDATIVGSHEGGWIASSQAPFMIINIFSGAQVVLSGEHIIHRLLHTSEVLVLRKITFSQQPTSSGCILAGITDKDELALYTVGCPETGWTVRGFYRDDNLMDIAFCNGELYGTTWSMLLLKFGLVRDNNNAGPVLLNIQWLCMLNNHRERLGENVRYIVELRGKLLTVGSNCNWWSVHQLVDTGIEKNTANSMKYKLVEVDNLGDHALFLGPTCSKAVRVPASGRGDVLRNHIYFSHHRCLKQKHYIPYGANKELLTRFNCYDHVYYKVVESASGAAQRILSVGYYVMGDVRPPMWLFP